VKNYKQIIISAVIIFFGCNEESALTNKCNPENPLQMSWMAEWVGELQNCACTISIFQAEYDGEPVFWPLITDPLCQTVIENVPVYNCNGDEILTLNNNADWQDFSEKLTGRKIIYVCSRP
jgi:hypothetical protein